MASKLKMSTDLLLDALRVDSYMLDELPWKGFVQQKLSLLALFHNRISEVCIVNRAPVDLAKVLNSVTKLCVRCSGIR